MTGVYREAIEIADHLTDPERYVLEEIIPRMDMRRGHLEPLTRGEITFRLLSTNPGKPGEQYELAGAMINTEKPGFVTPDFALEVADVYRLHRLPNSPPIENLDLFLYITLGENGMEMAARFCALKYLTRLKFGDLPDHKLTEELTMADYLKQLALRDPFYEQ